MLFDLLTELLRRDPQGTQDTGGHARLLPHQPEKKIFREDIAMAPTLRFLLSRPDSQTRPLREPLIKHSSSYSVGILYLYVSAPAHSSIEAARPQDGAWKALLSSV